jgi:hypothetical protein
MTINSTVGKGLGNSLLLTYRLTLCVAFRAFFFLLTYRLTLCVACAFCCIMSDFGSARSVHLGFSTFDSLSTRCGLLVSMFDLSSTRWQASRLDVWLGVNSQWSSRVLVVRLDVNSQWSSSQLFSPSRSGFFCLSLIGYGFPNQDSRFCNSTQPTPQKLC